MKSKAMYVFGFCTVAVVAMTLIVPLNRGYAECEILKGCILESSPCRTCSSGALFRCGFEREGEFQQSILEDSSSDDAMEIWAAFGGMSLCYTVYGCIETEIDCPGGLSGSFICEPGDFISFTNSYNNYLGTVPCDN